MSAMMNEATTAQAVTEIDGPWAPPKILIAGLGDVFLQDAGVGIHVVRWLADSPPRDVGLAEVGISELQGLHLLEWADKILAVDAMKAGGRPGAVYVLGGCEAEACARQLSLHERNVLGALRFLPGYSPSNILMVGVEPETIDYGVGLSPAVRKAVPRVVRIVCDLVDRWKRNPGRLARLEMIECAS